MELKELLKPPFRIEVLKDKEYEGVIVITDAENLQVVGIAFDYRFAADWICKAIQEKYERDFTELRWIKVPQGRDTYHICPKCERDEYVHTPNYCAGCGARLLPPEGEEYVD